MNLIGEHLSKSYDQDLQNLVNLFLKMGGMAEANLTKAIESLVKSDVALAEDVIDGDKEINFTEQQLDDLVVKVLARRQPAASDLRMIIAISKAIIDLERIGDEAAKIARYAQVLCEEGESPRGYVETRHIGNQVRVMLHDTLDAFARLDVKQALAVMQSDREIDLEYKTATRALMTYMMEDPRYIARVLNVMWVLRSLERIGDHARNVAEQLVYLVQGTDIRHISDEALRKRIDGQA